jgi:hypothetical protein
VTEPGLKVTSDQAIVNTNQVQEWQFDSILPPTPMRNARELIPTNIEILDKFALGAIRPPAKHVNNDLGLSNRQSNPLQACSGSTDHSPVGAWLEHCFPLT